MIVAVMMMMMMAMKTTMRDEEKLERWWLQGPWRGQFRKQDNNSGNGDHAHITMVIMWRRIKMVEMVIMLVMNIISLSLLFKSKGTFSEAQNGQKVNFTAIWDLNPNFLAVLRSRWVSPLGLPCDAWAFNTQPFQTKGTQSSGSKWPKNWVLGSKIAVKMTFWFGVRNGPKMVENDPTA